MTTLDMSTLESIANITYEDFLTFVSIGNNRAEVYYTTLGIEAQNAGLQNVQNYAQLAKGVVTDSTVNGVLANYYTATYANDESIDFSPSSDARLDQQKNLFGIVINRRK